ncbi:alpha/beta hydrolase [Kitasatospora herbaricolor]|uniref:alpha/beta hydrolase n=1 Tax=Kitasatospora herbaricolor TaxID=68217 RepID=UPI00174EB7A6|nr:alpha/beta hydrolase [Kitasatospora herbaricolor]MDQ0306086.1 acetyl esterase [Kitasatospora herbaricolor]GGV23419.1 alpha/beta hydrolase [Kitasatospora herbaricolor]
MPLHPQLQTLRDQRARNGAAPLYSLSVEEARAADLASVRAAAGSPRALYEVTDLRIPGPGGELTVRVHRPSAGRPLPALLYYFGGGWTLGSIETADGLCRDLAAEAGCLVVTVGYRLAPEHPFPAAVHDCHAALRWVAGHAEELGVDPARIAVGGDSAGGNLAAAVTLLARADGDLALAGQLLVYPNTDQLADDASMRDNTDPWQFNHHSVAWYRRQYLTTPGDAEHPLASPLRAADLSGLPPALVVTAEYDPLRDQGEAYAARLAAAGVPVELTRYPGMAHGFFTMTGTLDAARAAGHQAARFLRDRFAPS